MEQVILLVEDDEGPREFAKRFLEKAGYKVFAFEDYDYAAEWIDANQNNPPDLVLTDFNYPDRTGGNLGGFHLSQKVRAVYGNTVPCIVMSGNGLTLSVEHTQNFDNKNNILVKPIKSKNQLISMVTTYINPIFAGLIRPCDRKLINTETPAPKAAEVLAAS